MIKYTLICENNHEFEGWFPNSKEYGRQQKKQMICCPSCDSSAVTKAIMAPNVKKSKTKVKNKPMPVQNQMMPASQAHTLFRRIGKYVKKNFEDVGENFYKEALKSDNGERDDKFYGTPSDEQVDDLLEKGIDLFHVPKIKDN